jgi:hypothetical protein
MPAAREVEWNGDLSVRVLALRTLGGPLRPEAEPRTQATE